MKWLDSFGWLEIDSMAGYSLTAGYSQMAGKQWKGWMVPNGWKFVSYDDGRLYNSRRDIIQENRKLKLTFSSISCRLCFKISFFHPQEV